MHRQGFISLWWPSFHVDPAAEAMPSHLATTAKRTDAGLRGQVGLGGQRRRPADHTTKLITREVACAGNTPMPHVLDRGAPCLFGFGSMSEEVCRVGLAQDRMASRAYELKKRREDERKAIVQAPSWSGSFAARCHWASLWPCACAELGRWSGGRWDRR